VNGDTARAIVTNDFRNDLLFSYKPTPGTVVFVAMARRSARRKRSGSGI